MSNNLVEGRPYRDYTRLGATSVSDRAIRIHVNGSYNISLSDKAKLKIERKWTEIGVSKSVYIIPASLQLPHA